MSNYRKKMYAGGNCSTFENNVPGHQNKSVIYSPQDHKYFDVNGQDATRGQLSFASTKVCVLNCPTQGFNDWERNGDTLQMKEVTLRLSLRRDMTASQAYQENFARVLLVYDLNWKLANPTAWTTADLSQVLNVNNEFAGATATAYTYQAVSNMDRYTILMDEDMLLDSFLTNTGVGDVSNFELRDQTKGCIMTKTVQLRRRLVKFAASNDETGTDIENGALLLITVGSQASYKLWFTSRLAFYDNSPINMGGPNSTALVKLKKQKRVFSGMLCYFDTIGSLVCAAGGTISFACCNLIKSSALGTTNYRRTGANIQLLGWKMRGFWSMTAGTTNVERFSKVYIWYDESTAGALPASNMLETPTAPYGFKPVEFGERIKIIRKYEQVLPSYNATLTANTATLFKIADKRGPSLRIKGHGNLDAITQFNDTIAVADGNIGRTMKGSFGIAASAASAGNTSEFAYSVRVIYRNM